MHQPEPVLRVEISNSHSLEVYLIRPGGRFPNFGLSGYDLPVETTDSSLVLRTTQDGTVTDREYDIDSPKAWRVIQRNIAMFGIVRGQKVMP